MADTFGIFREDTVPSVHGVVKDAPLFMKGKGHVQNIKKKALGDVSNTVSQKALNVQHPEKSGSLLHPSSALQDLSVSCKSVVQTKETPDNSPSTCIHCFHIAESDCDIVPKSQRPSERDIDLFTSFYHFQTASAFKKSFDLPDLSSTEGIFRPEDVILPFDDLEELHLTDVSISSLDESNISDVSF